MPERRSRGVPEALRLAYLGPEKLMCTGPCPWEGARTNHRHLREDRVGGAHPDRLPFIYSLEAVMTAETHRASSEPALSVVHSLHPPNVPLCQGGD